MSKNCLGVSYDSFTRTQASKSPNLATLYSVYVRFGRYFQMKLQLNFVRTRIYKAITLITHIFGSPFKASTHLRGSGAVQRRYHVKLNGTASVPLQIRASVWRPSIFFDGIHKFFLLRNSHSLL